MSTLLAFAGSNSSTSINFKLVKYTVSLLKDHQVQTIDMHFFPLPMYSEDHERVNGYSNSLTELRETIQKVDGLLISVNEHNSNPSAYFKNLIDWLSRLERKFLEGKKILLMSTSAGKRGAIGALGVIEKMIPRFGGEVVATFSLPSFKENFDTSTGILDAELAKQHRIAMEDFLQQLQEAPI